ncbi:radical SAM protein, partial [Candidatus Thorarchaeota archaeon]
MFFSVFFGFIDALAAWFVEDALQLCLLGELLWAISTGDKWRRTDARVGLDVMRLATIIDISLVDVPGIPVTVIFTAGCNFDCPYCQNAEIIPLDSGTEMTVEEIVKEAQGHLTDGYCITGGEPTIYKGLPEMLRALREEEKHINL